MLRNPEIIKSSSQWKPIAVDPGLLGTGDFEGLVCIEELTDYTVHKSKSDSQVLTSDDDDDHNDKQRTTSSKISSNKNLDSTKSQSKNVKHENLCNFSRGYEVTASTVKSTSRWEARPLKPSSPGHSKKNEKVSQNSSGIQNGKEVVTTNYVQRLNSNIKYNRIVTPNILKKDESDVPSGMDTWNQLGVPMPLLHALAEMGFTTPTSIQTLTLPAAIFGRRDILGAAETGSGKTLAFGIPILSGILHSLSNYESTVAKHLQPCDESGNGACAESEDQTDEECSIVSSNGSENDMYEDGSERDVSGNRAELVKVIKNADFDFLEDGKEVKATCLKKPLYALILTPTRELAMQVTEHLKLVAKYTGIHVAVVVGGMSSQKQNRILNCGPEIVVATPGRLWDLISEGHPHLQHVEDIRYLAIDETDRMLEKGHFDELQRLLERINANDEQKHRRQNFVFSATLSLTHDAPHYVKRKKGKTKAGNLKVTPSQKLSRIIDIVGLTNPKVVDITESSGVAHALTEAHIVCSLEEKDFYLYYFLLRYPGRTLVFCNSINCVKRLAHLFSLLKCPTSPLHANMHQSQRLRNLERFRDNPKCVLLATDVAARGLDIPKVQHVIHYQVPRTAESYVHRSGRTARAHEEGITVIFVEPKEVRDFSRLFHTLGRDAVIPIFPVEERFMPAIKERVHLARQLEMYELQERRSNSERGWIGKLSKDMDIELSDHEASDNETSSSSSKMVKKKVDLHRRQLNSLLEKPLFPKGFSFKFPTYSSSDVVPNLLSVSSPDDDKSAINVLKQDMEKKRAEKRKQRNKKSGSTDKRKKVSL